MNKKILIPIIIILIIAAGIGAYFIFPRPAFPEPPQRDISKDSPFGFHAKCESSVIESCESVRDIHEVGAKWVRFSGVGDGLVWEAIEKEKGKYDWSNTDNRFSQANQEGLSVMATVGVINRFYNDLRNPKFIPRDWNAYERYLRTAVERYDGDGIDDAPGSPIVNYWQIENEIDNEFFWKDSPDNYALLLKRSYQIIKSANPNAKILMAGAGGPLGISYYWRILFVLNKIKDKPNDRYFDIFDFHWYPLHDWNSIPVSLTDLSTKVTVNASIATIKTKLTEFGYKDTPIWMTETGIWSDKPPASFAPEKSESEQAQYLLKIYVNTLAHQIEKIFWYTLRETVLEGGRGESGKFGLISNPLNKHRLSHKKLGYYTYKKISETLEGSDWNNIQTIRESDGIYIYKFTKQGKPVWVAWNDSSLTRTVTISGISSNRVKATEAVPKYESGKEVADYTTAFRMDTLAISNGVVVLTLGMRPVFVEPLTATSVEDKRENVPQEFRLDQNYPNPFNPTTTIRFSIPQRSHLTLKVFDALGREVAMLVNGELSPGEHSVVLDAKNLSSGVYFYRLTTPTFSQTKSMEVLK